MQGNLRLPAMVVEVTKAAVGYEVIQVMPEQGMCSCLGNFHATNATGSLMLSIIVQGLDVLLLIQPPLEW